MTKKQARKHARKCAKRIARINAIPFKVFVAVRNTAGELAWEQAK